MGLVVLDEWEDYEVVPKMHEVGLEMKFQLLSHKRQVQIKP